MSIDAQMALRLRNRGMNLTVGPNKQYATPELKAIATEFSAHTAALMRLDKRIKELADQEEFVLKESPNAD